MTRNRLVELREQRARLIERARAERERFGVLLARAEAAFSWVEALQRVLADARRRPLLVLAGAALLVAIRPRRAVKLLASGWSLWQLYQRLRRWWALAAPIAAGATARRR